MDNPVLPPPLEPGWSFTDQNGSFRLDNPHHTSYLYFPLVNEKGMMSCVTPLLHGDAKTGQNSFLLAPVSVEDLHTSRAARNFWVAVEGLGIWSATGNSAPQIAQSPDSPEADTVRLEAGFLWHKITRENASMGLRAEIVNFVPMGDDQVELMRVTLSNLTSYPLTITPTAAIPLYGRSADNLRDHRHVTSLLHRIHTHPHGVLVRPTLSFDERGHKPNQVTYGVLGTTGDGTPPVCFFPAVEDFIGEGGSYEWPESVVHPSGAGWKAGASIEGYEAVGALRFDTYTLPPGQSQSYILILAIMPDPSTADTLVKRYGSDTRFDTWLDQCKAHWRAKLEALSFRTADPAFDAWMQWVTLQPVLRRLFGNSFLPYHDYGRGGRGWRDLWQDCLALLIMEPGEVRRLLLSNYAGVRIDGSNATIIGAQPGEFLADRNNIPRVWMDHGTWPFLTTLLYLNQSGDLGFLLQEQTYFKDRHINRAHAHDDEWTPDQGTLLRTRGGEPYRGTILEHLLVQHLTAFFNVGEHNIIRLEGADWNDGMDMAAQRGESVAFTALYASNLRELSRIVLELDAHGVPEVELAGELLPLLDTLSAPVDYQSIAARQQRLGEYFTLCAHDLSGARNKISAVDLADDLAAKADWLFTQLRHQEWIAQPDGSGWFNGYYDNDGHPVEGVHPNGVRMTLTGQVFALMGGIATDEQAQAILQAADRYLLDPALGGYRLNTDFGGVQLNLGRCFGFAFGHKENGAMFSHMAVMYANALYQRGLVHEGYRVFERLYRHCADFATSRIYPGIPEYISARGRGMYTYLTGSASWLLLTLVTEVFGVKGDLGHLALEPKLVREQFDAHGDAQVFTLFADRSLTITYHNPAYLDYGEYAIQGIMIDGMDVSPLEQTAHRVLLVRETLENLDRSAAHTIEIRLG